MVEPNPLDSPVFHSQKDRSATPPTALESWPMHLFHLRRPNLSTIAQMISRATPISPRCSVLPVRRILRTLILTGLKFFNCSIQRRPMSTSRCSRMDEHPPVILRQMGSSTKRLARHQFTAGSDGLLLLRRRMPKYAECSYASTAEPVSGSYLLVCPPKQRKYMLLCDGPGFPSEPPYRLFA